MRKLRVLEIKGLAQILVEKSLISKSEPLAKFTQDEEPRAGQALLRPALWGGGWAKVSWADTRRAAAPNTKHQETL